MDVQRPLRAHYNWQSILAGDFGRTWGRDETSRLVHAAGRCCLPDAGDCWLVAPCCWLLAPATN